MRGRYLKTFVSELVRAIARHRVRDTAATLGFWSLLALFPFMIFLLTLMGFLPLAGLEREVLDLVHDVMPSQAAAVFDRTLHEIVNRQRGGLLLVSLAGAIWTASGGMGTAMAALNLAHGVTETRPWWRRRLLGIGLTLAAAGCITVATALLLIGPNLVRGALELLGRAPDLHNLWRWSRYPVAIVVLLFMLGSLYHFLPNRRLKWRFVTPGSLSAVGLFVCGSLAFNAYVSHFHNYARTYGALGAAVILLFWLYLSALMLLLGVEIDAALARTRQHLTAQEPQPAGSGTGEEIEGGAQVHEGG